MSALAAQCGALCVSGRVVSNQNDNFYGFVLLGFQWIAKNADVASFVSPVKS